MSRRYSPTAHQSEERDQRRRCEMRSHDRKDDSEAGGNLEDEVVVRPLHMAAYRLRRSNRDSDLLQRGQLLPELMAAGQNAILLNSEPQKPVERLPDRRPASARTPAPSCACA
jgi:hypothetical protein